MRYKLLLGYTSILIGEKIYNFKQTSADHGDNMIRALLFLFTSFLLISSVIHPVISEKALTEVIGESSNAEDTERLVDHVIVSPYSETIFIQVIDLLLHLYDPIAWGTVHFGNIDFYDITDDKPITLHINYSTIWEDNHTVLSRYSFKCKLSRNSSFGFSAGALVEDVYKKVKTPVGHYTIRLELYVEEDSSSKVVEIPGVMFYYICMLSTGPFLLSYLKVLLSYIPWANEHLHDFIYSDVWDP